MKKNAVENYHLMRVASSNAETWQWKDRTSCSLLIRSEMYTETLGRQLINRVNQLRQSESHLSTVTFSLVLRLLYLSRIKRRGTYTPCCVFSSCDSHAVRGRQSANFGLYDTSPCRQSSMLVHSSFCSQHPPMWCSFLEIDNGKSLHLPEIEPSTDLHVAKIRRIYQSSLLLIRSRCCCPFVYPVARKGKNMEFVRRSIVMRSFSGHVEFAGYLLQKAAFIVGACLNR